MYKLSKAQQRSLLNLYNRLRENGPAPVSFLSFRRSVKPFVGDDCVMVPWCGMWVGIEIDGYAHS